MIRTPKNKDFSMNVDKTEFKTFGTNGKQPVVEHYNFKKAILRLKALHHKLRIQILKILDENQQVTVTEIFIKLRMEQSLVSQHLAILRNAGVVNAERKGKQIFYSLNVEQIEYLNDISLKVIK